MAARAEKLEPRSFTGQIAQGGMHLCVVSFKECWQDERGRWLSDGGFPTQIGGVASLFHRVTLVITRCEQRTGGALLPSSARVVTVRQPVGADLRRKLSILAGLPYYLREISRALDDADVVHIPLPGDIPLLALLIALARRKRVIARYCGSWHATRQTTLMNRVTRSILRRAAGDRNIVLATGESNELPAPRVRWLFATALSSEELARIRPSLKRGLADPPRLVYIGRLSVEKGLLHLIDAVALLRREGRATLPRVVLVGDGPQRDALELRIREMKCEDQFTLTGQLGRALLSEVLLECDFAVQPSLTEGFSKAWLDAMAHGLPVISSDVGAAREVIGSEGERGWLVPPGDSAALADKLHHVLRAPLDWLELRSRCRQYAEERTIERWVARIGSLCASQWGMSYADGKLVR